MTRNRREERTKKAKCPKTVSGRHNEQTIKADSKKVLQYISNIIDMYWLVSLPLDIGSTVLSSDRVWARLQELTSLSHHMSTNWKFNLPDNLRVGTLDSLMALSDDLIKVNAAVEGTVNKIRRQLYELQSSSSGSSSMMTDQDLPDINVEGVSPESYLQRFSWNEPKYPSRRPTKETVSAIMETVQKLDDDLKTRSMEYTQAKASLQAILRKRTGSLAVRDLSDIVPLEKIVSTENLTTLVTVVPKSSEREWMSSYETLTEYVVPRSSTKVAEDAEYVAFIVVLFRRVIDDFKLAARAQGCQAKELPAAAEPFNGEISSSDGADNRRENGIVRETHGSRDESNLERLQAEVDARRKKLGQWCITSYGEAFSSWIHIISIRLFVESILRYGLPPQFLPVLIKPVPKYSNQLRKVLATNFAAIGGEYYSNDGTSSSAGAGVASGGPGEDLYSYVSFTLSIEES